MVAIGRRESCVLSVNFLGTRLYGEISEAISLKLVEVVR